MDHLEKIIEQNESRFGFFGVRGHHESVSVGDSLANSYHTFDGDEGEELEGVCTVGINWDGFESDGLDSAIEIVKKLYALDGPIILVGGTGREFGHDEREVIISGAEVLAIIE